MRFFYKLLLLTAVMLLGACKKEPVKNTNQQIVTPPPPGTPFVPSIKLDSTFHSSSTAGFQDVQEIIIQADDKILLRGRFTTYDGAPCGYILRLEKDGRVDKTFKCGTGFDKYINDFELQADGKIVVVGENITSYNGTPVKQVVRLNSNGTIDQTFDIGTSLVGGGNSTTYPQKIKLIEEGKMLIGVHYHREHWLGDIDDVYVVKIYPEGTRVSDFGSADLSGKQITGLEVQTDGKIIVSGDFYEEIDSVTTCKGIARLEKWTGNVDPTFKSGLGFDDNISKIWLQSDGKILISGYIRTYDGKPSEPFIRIRTNGARDNSFNCDLNYEVYDLEALTGGNMFVVGTFYQWNGAPCTRYLAKIFSNGYMDYSFGVGECFDDWINTIARQSDGKYVVGGYFTSFNGKSAGMVARFK